MTPLELRDLFNKINEAHDAVRKAEREFLRAAGWASTCEVGSIWLWKRGENPVVYLSTDMAIHLTAEELIDEEEDANRPAEEDDDGAL